MTRLLIIADTETWCFAHRAKALQTHAPDDFEVAIQYCAYQEIQELPLDRYDVIFLMVTVQAGVVRRHLADLGWEGVLVVSHNSGLGRRTEYLFGAMLAADAVVVNNHAAWEATRRYVRPERFNACNISNGVDTSIFHPTTPMAERARKVIWVGAEVKTEEPAVFSPGDVKGYSNILVPLGMILEGKGLEVEWRKTKLEGQHASPAKMAEWYNSASVVVCTSETEGTPNFILEAAACGCAVVSTQVGNIPEAFDCGRNAIVVNRRHTPAFMEACEFAMEHRVALGAGAAEAMRTWGWSQRSAYFFALFRRLHQQGSMRPFSYLGTTPEEV